MTTLGIIIVVVLSVMVFNDAKDVKENFAGSTSVFLLQQDKTVNAGFYTKFIEGADPSFIDEAKLNSFKGNFEGKKYEAIQGNHYKIFFMKEKAFDDDIVIKIGDKEIKKQEALDMIASENPIESYAEDDGQHGFELRLVFLHKAVLVVVR